MLEVKTSVMRRLISRRIFPLFSLLIPCIATPNMAYAIPILGVNLTGDIVGARTTSYTFTEQNDGQDHVLKLFSTVNYGDPTPADLTITISLQLVPSPVPPGPGSSATYLVRDLLNSQGAANSDPGISFGAGTFTLDNAATGNKPNPDQQAPASGLNITLGTLLIPRGTVVPSPNLLGSLPPASLVEGVVLFDEDIITRDQLGNITHTVIPDLKDRFSLSVVLEKGGNNFGNRVPEPSSVALMGIGLSFLFWRRLNGGFYFQAHHCLNIERT